MGISLIACCLLVFACGSPAEEELATVDSGFDLAQISPATATVESDLHVGRESTTGSSPVPTTIAAATPLRTLPLPIPSTIEPTSAGRMSPSPSATVVITVIPVTPIPSDNAIYTPTATPSLGPTPTASPPLPTPTQVSTAAPTLTPTRIPATAGPRIEIACVFFDGEVPRSESDEYVEIINSGSASTDLSGWTLIDSADGRPSFAFPAITLASGETVRVYTNQLHPESGGLSFGSGAAIWSNSEPDEATLLNTSGEAVSSASYPPGCEGL
ncbi:MAG: lamin tail domain-containing protein [Chloroflexi bacterium]|nr:lamin tail domain-containing protein [Chloroflexota bacterium]